MWLFCVFHVSVDDWQQCDQPRGAVLLWEVFHWEAAWGPRLRLWVVGVIKLLDIDHIAEFLCKLTAATSGSELAASFLCVSLRLKTLLAEFCSDSSYKLVT